MSAERTTTLRLRRVRFKSGGSVEVLRPRRDMTTHENFVRCTDRAANEALDSEIVGFAVVAWSRCGQVFVNFDNGNGSPLPGGAVPNFVRDVLLAEQAVRWSRD